LGGLPQLRGGPPKAWPGSPAGFLPLGSWALSPGVCGGGVLQTPSLAFPGPLATLPLFLSWSCGGGALEAPFLALYPPAFKTPLLGLGGLPPGPGGLFSLARLPPLDLRRGRTPRGGLTGRTKGPLRPGQAPGPSLPSSRPPGGKGQEEKEDEEVGQEEPPGKRGKL
jgi:hypothetical protein